MLTGFDFVLVTLAALLAGAVNALSGSGINMCAGIMFQEKINKVWLFP